MSDYFEFPNLGVSVSRLTDEQLVPIWTEVDAIQANWDRNPKHNSKLMGQIEQEYTLVDSRAHIESLVIAVTKDYLDKYNYSGRTHRIDGGATEQLTLTPPWVNFQKAGEENPIHTHGGLMSFVLWLQLPYDIKTEQEQAPGRASRKCLAGHFNFHWTDILGQLQHYHIPADRTREGTLVLFPSELAHSVNPFYTSDEYRITISGNIFRL
jgi:hypothetical protein